MRPVNKIAFVSAVACVCILTGGAFAHTISIGYESGATAGSVDFWFGTYHPSSEASYTEGSLQVTGPNNFSATETFTQLVTTKPGGLVDGVTNFYSNGTVLGTTNAYANRGPADVWQGVIISGLTPGTYTFTYIPIASPTSVWDPIDGVILSSSVTLTSDIIYGGASHFVDNSTSGSHGTALTLDNLAGNATGDMGATISYLQSLSSADQRTALSHIAPNTSLAVGNSSTQAVTGALDSVQVRLNNLRSQSMDSPTLTRLEQGGTVQIADNDADLSNLFVSNPKTDSFWMKAFGGFDRQSADNGFAGYHSRTGGATIGADTLLDRSWIAGGALTYASTRVNMDDFRAGDSARIQSYQITGYSSYNFGDWYMEGMLAYARQNFDSSRDTTVSGIASASFTGNDYASRITAGEPIDLDEGYILTPTQGVEVGYLNESAYTEEGAGPLSLHVSSADAVRVRSLIGSRITKDYDYEGTKIQPSLTTTWRYDFKNDGVSSTSNFTGGGDAFTTPGQKPPRNSADIAAAVNVSQSDDFSVSLQLDTEQMHDYSSYSGQAQVQWHF